MYAMDQTMHFEHSGDAQRRTRWDLHRPTARVTATTTLAGRTTGDSADQGDVDTSATHEFLD